MTDATPCILAADDVGGMIKLAFWVVVILIFIMVKVVRFIGRLISPSATAKPANAPPPMRNAQRLPALPARAPMAAGAIALPPLPTKAGAKVRRKVARKVAPAQVTGNATLPLGRIVDAIQQTRITSPEPLSVAVSRSRVAGWLDARTIRAQFVLSEAMKPPISMR